MFHPDEDVNSAIVRLIDALTSWERSTGRESFLVLVPVESEERVVVVDSGRLMDLESLTDELIAERVLQALVCHDNPEVHRFIDG